MAMDETATIRPPSEPVLSFREKSADVARQEPEGPDFDRVVAEHQARIVRLVGRFVDNRAEIEDVVQEVFLAALRNLDRFRGESRFSTWLASIAVNRCRSLHRRRALRRRLLPWLAVPNKVEDNRAEASETGEEVRRAVRQLPTKYREPIVLRYFEGMTVAEIAEVLGLAVNTVEVRLSRARKTLKKTLQSRLER
ncbi:MAG: RNA polymerase sigma factor [Pirellulales bacterium]|nr:RNA polymerase sigma factor [Pirellulales bacterium]